MKSLINFLKESSLPKFVVAGSGVGVLDGPSSSGFKYLIFDPTSDQIQLYKEENDIISDWELSPEDSNMQDEKVLKKMEIGTATQLGDTDAYIFKLAK